VKPFMEINTLKLLGYLLDQPWHNQCEIIPEYMPKFPHADTKPRVVVRYNNGTEYPAFLRYSCGPQQGYFWDSYGDEMQNIELAIIALSKAPFPRSVSPIQFSIPIK